MDFAELHDKENLHTQMEDRWENYGSLDGIIDTDDPVLTSAVDKSDANSP